MTQPSLSEKSSLSENSDLFDANLAKAVLEQCRALSSDPSLAYKFTSRFNTVAVITDGSNAPSLGDIGPLASLPLVEQKARLLNQTAQINTLPLVLDSQSLEDTVRTVKSLALSLGAINLEAVNETASMEIKRRLEEIEEVPVLHDNLDALPVLCLAALLNALKVVNKKMNAVKIVLASPESEALSMVDFFRLAGVTDIIVCDKTGAIHPSRPGHTNWVKEELALKTNPRQIKGPLAKVAVDSDVLIVISSAVPINKDLVSTMAPQAIIFNLTETTKDNFFGAAVTAGKSDLNSNLLSPYLVVPGLLRGSLDARARVINAPMKMAAALAISKLVPEADLGPSFIIPSVSKHNLVSVLAEAVSTAAAASGVSRLI
ncbi:MAG: hypothetical protein LBT62_01390 [Deltaproteobacteria bacterium]|jgi:malate dehydrogenase (oxaloacetate-decarboxylating)|nr:hypothetical protein [Deltaproteobacteria bacterium]